MKTISINTAVRHNSISIEYYRHNDIVVCIKEEEYSKLEQYVVKLSSEVIIFKSDQDLLIKLNSLDYINEESRAFSASEDFVYLAAKIRENFNLPGMKSDEVKYFRDKCLMKDKAASYGVNTPKHGVMADHISYSQIVTQVGLPFILKPRDSAGAYGVYLIENPDEYTLAINEMSLDYEYQYESYIKGKLYHVDILLQDSINRFSAVCELSSPTLDFQSGKPCLSLVINENMNLHRQLVSFAEYSVRSLGLTSGPAHVEIFVKDSGELVFLEAACRTPGAVIVPLYEAQYGFNMIEASLDIECGNMIEYIEKSSKFCMSGIFPTPKGSITKINPLEIQSTFKLTLNCQIGDSYNDVTSLKSVAGSIVVTGENYDVIRRDFEKLKTFSLAE